MHVTEETLKAVCTLRVWHVSPLHMNYEYKTFDRYDTAIINKNEKSTGCRWINIVAFQSRQSHYGR